MPGGDAELAPAKVNLALHVTGRRPDGYHLLDSLVAFPAIGDRVEAEPAAGLSLTLDGPFARDLGAGPDNLVLRAAQLIRPEGKGAAIRLVKSLPVASGIGGGSSDAAAALRLLARLWEVPLPPAEQLAALGADVPVCLRAMPQRMQGIGERLTPVELPPFWIVLANPGFPVATLRSSPASRTETTRRCRTCRPGSHRPRRSSPGSAEAATTWRRRRSRFSRRSAGCSTPSPPRRVAASPACPVPAHLLRGLCRCRARPASVPDRRAKWGA
jgi:4-diphosphocytidyl-2C-methyl-D-erythritol kinase